MSSELRHLRYTHSDQPQMIKKLLFQISRRLELWQVSLSIAHTSRLFIQVLYLFVFVNFIRLLPISEIIWGQQSFVILNKVDSGFQQLAFLMNVDFFRANFRWFLYPIMILTFFGIFGCHNFFSRVAVFFLFVNLHYGNHEISNGGHNLVQQFLFLHIFWFKVSEGSTSFWTSFMRLVHHLSFYGAWVQLCIVYLSAGLLKLKGNLWLDGSAISHVLSIEEYSLPSIISIAWENPWWMKLATWVTLIYQLTFPWIIWIKNSRSILLFLGTVIHLGIAFIVGITDFGMIMVISYLLFLPNNKVAFWKEWIAERINFKT